MEKNLEKQSGFSLIGILLIIGALILTAGGVVVWERKVGPTPIPSPTPTPTAQTKMPWDGSVCGNGICESCENECCNYPCITDTISGQLMCPPPTCLGYCPQDCRDSTRYPNPCPAGQAPVYEGGIFSNCVDLSPTSSSTPTLEKNCAVDGESPTNFDMTTGKFIPGGKPCCAGLKAIGPKTPLDALNKGVCMHKMGTVGVCRPCGNGICNSEYEDRCNCPEDCR